MGDVRTASNLDQALARAGDGAFAVGAYAPGCGTAPPPQPVADLKLIVGTWRGSNGAGSPVDLIVYANGSFEAIITAPQQTLHRTGQIRMEGQQFVYDADSSYGRIAYFESDGKRRLIMSGTLRQGGQQFVIEYLPSNR